MKKRQIPELVREVMSIIGNEDTLREMSDKTQISQTTLHRIRSGTAPLSIENLEKIMKGYKITWHKVLWKLTSPKGGES